MYLTITPNFMEYLKEVLHSADEFQFWAKNIDLLKEYQASQVDCPIQPFSFFFLI